MKRFYQASVLRHFRKYRQMLFLMGPRQVGKTTLSQMLKEEWEPGVHYLSWEKPEDQRLIASGAADVMLRFNLGESRSIPNRPIIAFDEIHRMTGWKNFLKMIFDGYPGAAHVLVTGSGHLDAFRRGGDGLMGRYFQYRIHPLTVGELLNQSLREEVLLPRPTQLPEDQFDALYRFGGYPEPLLSGDEELIRRWREQRFQQLMYEDLRDMTRFRDFDRIQLLARLLQEQAGQLVTYETLGRRVQVSGPSIKQWIRTLEALYFCFAVRPWSANVNRALTKEPKYYPFDWASVDDPGARAESFVALHLLKAVDYWTDSGKGTFALHFIRDREKREVDFLIVKDRKPWMLVEVKARPNKGVSRHLHYFAERLQPEYALQVVLDMNYVDWDCFVGPHPMVVPARTFLSQLV